MHVEYPSFIPNIQYKDIQNPLLTSSLGYISACLIKITADDKLYMKDPFTERNIVVYS
jgi:hypothetical protein